MAKWTQEQEAILEELASLGPEAIAAEIAERTGKVRTARAVQRHASRMRVSLVRYQTCPRCGRARRRLNRWSGLCEYCNMRELRDRQQRESAELDRIRREVERDATGDPEYKAMQRDYNRVMRDNERKAEELGVRRRNEGWAWTGYGDSANLSTKMSTPRSER